MMRQRDHADPGFKKNSQVTRAHVYPTTYPTPNLRANVKR